jgi:glycosyltransferase involved in cell wall biosynthesis
MPSAEKNKRSIKIFFQVPAPTGISPGQRFRFEHYLPALEQAGIKYAVHSFYSFRDWKTLFTKGQALRKGWIVVKGFLRRMVDVFRMLPYDYVYLYREATPIGPPVFEWIAAKLMRKKIIYDFDDAIWIPAKTENNKFILRLKWFGKVSAICRWSYKVSTGNAFLGDYATKYNKDVVIIPTVVDTQGVHNRMREQSADPVVIGWTGTFSTLKYLDIIMPSLIKLQSQHEFTFIVIADKDPQLPLKNYMFLPWSKNTEITDLLRMHIGLMPLYDDELSKGKCGFKAIQYMALGIPAVVSPVGVNAIIVDDGVNGYVCSDEKQWEDRLTELLMKPDLRRQMGKDSRKKIEERYSVRGTQDLFIQLFQ